MLLKNCEAEVPAPEIYYQGNTSEQVQYLRASDLQSRLYWMKNKFVRGPSLGHKYLRTAALPFYSFSFHFIITKAALCEVSRGSGQDEIYLLLMCV
jgi:hypothetical protein